MSGCVCVSVPEAGTLSHPSPQQDWGTVLRSFQTQRLPLFSRALLFPPLFFYFNSSSSVARNCLSGVAGQKKQGATFINQELLLSLRRNNLCNVRGQAGSSYLLLNPPSPLGLYNLRREFSFRLGSLYPIQLYEQAILPVCTRLCVCLGKLALYAICMYLAHAPFSLGRLVRFFIRLVLSLCVNKGPCLGPGRPKVVWSSCGFSRLVWLSWSVCR